MRTAPGVAAAVLLILARSSAAASDAPPAAPRVVVVVVGEPTPQLDETRVRLVAELGAAGFAAELPAPGATALGARPAPPLALAFVEQRGGAVAIDLTIGADQGERAQHLVQVGSSAELAPAALAVRAVELLRLRLGEPAAPRAAPSLPAGAAGTVAARTAAPAGEAPPRARAQLGMGAFTGADGRPDVLALTAGAAYLPGAGPLDEIGLRGLASFADRTVSAAQGSARLGRAYLRAHAARALWRSGSLGARGLLALGVMRLAATGDAVPPALGLRVTSYAPIAAASAELSLAVSRALSLALEVEVMGALRDTTLVIGVERERLPRWQPGAALHGRWSF